MSATPKQYVDLAGLTVYHEEIKSYIEDQIPDLSELDSVAIDTPTNNQGLVYNESEDKWENKSVLISATVSNETLVLAQSKTFVYIVTLIFISL